MSVETAEEFLSICEQFRLGDLITESPHPTTASLSQILQDGDVETGLQQLQAVDSAALKALVMLPTLSRDLCSLSDAVHRAFETNHRVFCVGCGATGRLSLSLEVFSRDGLLASEPEYHDKVVGFMAGGDAALIKSIEQFEDKVEHGQRQLRELGFVDGDVLIAITEGGETPFVIAACEEALVVSPSVTHYFMYCNPDSILCRVAERSRRVIENSKIYKINVTCGPMAITGSTRMQATTVQLLCAGLAIRHHNSAAEEKKQLLEGNLAMVARTFDSSSIDYGRMAPFTRAEAALYREGEFFLYDVDPSTFGITVMTDTTERSPTFTMPPFENFDKPEINRGQPPSQVYLRLRGVDGGAAAAWRSLLRRDPRPLEWSETKHMTGLDAVLGFDFSECVADRRRRAIGEDRTRHRCCVDIEGSIVLRFTIPSKAILVDITVPSAVAKDLFLLNIVVKCLLNAHSTAVMGINGRYTGNVMTYVKPTNNKLIDRAARYVLLILKQQQQQEQEQDNKAALPSYEDVVRRLFEQRENVLPTAPVVWHLVQSYL